MIDKITSILPNHVLLKTSSQNIYIVDYKNLNGGNVELLESEPLDIKSIYLENIQPINIIFDGFKENALPLNLGLHNSQCECILFPESCNDSDWALLIEAKYANDRKKAFDEKHDYPNCMINQIIETAHYFRNKKIIPDNKRIHAIVSFPNLVEEFNSYFCNDQVEEILFTHKILIRATNSALIKSQKRITLNSF